MRRLFVALPLLALSLGACSDEFSITQIDPPEDYVPVDENGVEVESQDGSVSLQIPGGSLKKGELELRVRRIDPVEGASRPPTAEFRDSFGDAWSVFAGFRIDFRVPDESAEPEIDPDLEWLWTIELPSRVTTSDGVVIRLAPVTIGGFESNDLLVVPPQYLRLDRSGATLRGAIKASDLGPLDMPIYIDVLQAETEVGSSVPPADADGSPYRASLEVQWSDSLRTSIEIDPSQIDVQPGYTFVPSASLDPVTENHPGTAVSRFLGTFDLDGAGAVDWNLALKLPQTDRLRFETHFRIGAGNAPAASVIELFCHDAPEDIVVAHPDIVRAIDPSITASTVLIAGDGIRSWIDTSIGEDVVPCAVNAFVNARTFTSVVIAQLDDPLDQKVSVLSAGTGLLLREPVDLASRSVVVGQVLRVGQITDVSVVGDPLDGEAIYVDYGRRVIQNFALHGEFRLPILAHRFEDEWSNPVSAVQRVAEGLILAVAEEGEILAFNPLINDHGAHIGSAGVKPLRIRVCGGLVAIANHGDTAADSSLSLLTWPAGGNPVVRGNIPASNGPVGLSLAKLADNSNGTIVEILSTGSRDNTYRVTRVREDNAVVVFDQEYPLPAGYTNPTHIAHLNQPGENAILISCTGSGNLLRIERE